MIKDQLDVITERLIKSAKQREAVSLHLLAGLTAYEAEKTIYGRVTSTVSRDAKRVVELYEFSKNLMSL